ncbi:MAG TPA: hypothetical protein VE987_01535 [Polyangiaceae bacterium]|nr:hypothetical protein [Polyangiaceae bacterium]
MTPLLVPVPLLPPLLTPLLLVPPELEEPPPSSFPELELDPPHAAAMATPTEITKNVRAPFMKATSRNPKLAAP